MIERFERFVTVISSISRNLHKIMTEEMEKYGLKGSYALYLVTLSRHSERLTAARLCDVCEKNKAAVSRAIKELESLGLVYRSGASYRATVSLTEEGKKAADVVCERARLAVDRAGSGLSETQREAFYLSLEKIAVNLQSIGYSGIPDGESYE